MRYHIASLVAVFLALTVGLLLGSLIVDKGVLADQQERLLDSIKEDVNEINSKNLALQSEVDRLRNFEEQVFPVAVRSRLNETSVTVVTLVEGQEEQAKEVEKTLAQAGAGTSRLHIKMKEIDLSAGTLKEPLKVLLEEGDVAGGELEKRFWSRVAIEMSGTGPDGLLRSLLDTGLAVGEDAALPLRDLVVIAASDRELGSRDILFLESLSGVPGVRVVAVENADTKPSRIGAYKLRNVSTIDNIDSVSGKISLVYLLTEREVTAHFGVKSAADKPMP